MQAARRFGPGPSPVSNGGAFSTPSEPRRCWAGPRPPPSTTDWPARSPGSSARPRVTGDHSMIDEELKAILVCPACKGDLLFEESRIICPACRKAYPIRDGIPVMLIDEAQPWMTGGCAPDPAHPGRDPRRRPGHPAQPADARSRQARRTAPEPSVPGLPGGAAAAPRHRRRHPVLLLPRGGHSDGHGAIDAGRCACATPSRRSRSGRAAASATPWTRTGTVVGAQRRHPVRRRSHRHASLPRRARLARRPSCSRASTTRASTGSSRPTADGRIRGASAKSRRRTRRSRPTP